MFYAGTPLIFSFGSVAYTKMPPCTLAWVDIFWGPPQTMIKCLIKWPHCMCQNLTPLTVVTLIEVKFGCLPVHYWFEAWPNALLSFGNWNQSSLSSGTISLVHVTCPWRGELRQGSCWNSCQCSWCLGCLLIIWWRLWLLMLEPFTPLWLTCWCLSKGLTFVCVGAVVSWDLYQCPCPWGFSSASTGLDYMFHLLIFYALSWMLMLRLPHPFLCSLPVDTTIMADIIMRRSWCWLSSTVCFAQAYLCRQAAGRWQNCPGLQHWRRLGSSSSPCSKGWWSPIVTIHGGNGPLMISGWVILLLSALLNEQILILDWCKMFPNATTILFSIYTVFFGKLWVRNPGILFVRIWDPNCCSGRSWGHPIHE